MAISETYSTFILNNILREILLDGASPSISEIEERFNAFTSSNDISQPLFSANNYIVESGQPASATNYNSANSSILQDLKVLYKHLFNVSDQTINNYERWRVGASLLEGRLDKLQARISSLLLVSEDTAGFLNFVQDGFSDNTNIDLENSTVFADVSKGVVVLGTNSIGPTKVDLSYITERDISFIVLSKTNLVSRNSASRSNIRHVVSDLNDFWQERIFTNKPGAVSAELKIDLGSTRDLSRIDVDLHQSNTNSAVQITPLLSSDNYNYQQLPISSLTRSVIDKTSFKFPKRSARWIKFVMTKPGFDGTQNSLYSYEFGVDQISIYDEGFSSGTESSLVSLPLSVADTDGNIQEFSRIVLEVCEEVPDNTSINYSVAVSNDESVELSTSVFVPIDPIGRENATKPTVLDFGELDLVSISGINISYDADDVSVGGIFTNPAQDFTVIDSVSGSSAIESSVLSSDARYLFLNSNDRILDHQIDTDIQIAQGTLEVWRNLSLKGVETKVRGYVNGWGFSDPYYSTTVYVSSAESFSIDFGSKTVIVDGSAKQGNIVFSKGRHTVRVHKDNWKYIDHSSLSDLVDLKSADPLYPYNHRYLVEGLSYPLGYSSTDEKIYRGFDIVAEHFMKQVSVFDLVNNVPVDSYDKYALDTDSLDEGAIIDSVLSTKQPNTVFLLKVDENNPDFTNEEFLIRFKAANSLFKYLRLKAVLSTQDPGITPVLDSYRIKISS